MQKTLFFSKISYIIVLRKNVKKIVHNWIYNLKIEAFFFALKSWRKIYWTLSGDNERDNENSTLFTSQYSK